MLKGSRIEKIKEALISGEFEKFRSALCAVSKLDIRIPYTLNHKPAWFPLINLALYLGHSHFLPLLIEQGAPLDHRIELKGEISRNGVTLLPFVKKDEDLLMLLRAGLSWHVHPGEGYSDLVIHQAARYGLHQSMEWLFKGGEYVDLKNKDNETPLQVLLGTDISMDISDKLKTLHLLLSQSPRLDIEDKEGWSLLHRASHCFPAAIIPLIKAGANFKTLDNDNLTIFDYLKQEIQIEKNRNQDGLMAFLYINGLMQNKVKSNSWIGPSS